MPSHGNFSKGDFDRAMSRLFGCCVRFSQHTRQVVETIEKSRCSAFCTTPPSVIEIIDAWGGRERTIRRPGTRFTSFSSLRISMRDLRYGLLSIVVL